MKNRDQGSGFRCQHGKTRFRLINVILIAISGAQMLEFFRLSERPLRSIVIGLACFLMTGPLFAQSGAENPAAVCAAKNRDDAATVDHFTFASYSSVAGGCLQVISGGKVIFRHAEEFPLAFTLGQHADAQYNIPSVANGTDVTGRGHPDMIVSEYTGGAHCCMSHYVFELDPEFKLLATLNDADDDLAHFQRAADGRYDYITADWTFAYWPDCFACSPSELVILRWADDANGGGFHLALEKMQKPAPSAASWSKELAAAHKVVSAGDVNSIGRTLWQTVLDLVYRGHSDLAWKFVDAAGPKAQQKPFPPLADFCGLLKQSEYWADLGPTLKDVPPACAAAGPAAKK
jgi:hypothetical protein